MPTSQNIAAKVSIKSLISINALDCSLYLARNFCLSSTGGHFKIEMFIFMQVSNDSCAKNDSSTMAQDVAFRQSNM